MKYRFPKIKDASWNSYNRHQERYGVIKHLLGVNAIGAEIGVYKGGFGEFLLPHCKKLYLVDPWDRLKPYWGEAKPENSAALALKNIKKVYQEEINSDLVEVVSEFSVPFLEGKKVNTFNWIYLDASHLYDHTLTEIRASLRVLIAGGYLIGDDYDPDPSSNQHGVYRAVNQIVEEFNLRLILNKNRQWAIKVN